MFWAEGLYKTGLTQFGTYHLCFLLRSLVLNRRFFPETKVICVSPAKISQNLRTSEPITFVSRVGARRAKYFVQVKILCLP
ncbi:hypothetical protein MiSe_62900 [Microseira wollei NIES-4236]|uniref:Uncharacterized protein n=1 Tax=Microseira wollei NIES-4236 TaxID=2530354 RepID=A0AAV3XGT2_9CYAN|nr:hypothetical protein MiSe_62900 [Microseira wollei NIES-4236]